MKVEINGNQHPGGETVEKTVNNVEVIGIKKITGVDDDKHKVSLSIRALSEPAPAPKADEPEEEPAPAEDALVYEVSADGEATGIAPEADETEA